MELPGRMKNTEIELNLKAFSFGQKQDAATLLKTLKKHGISTDDFLSYVQEEKRRSVQARKQIEKRRSEILKRIPKCRDCGGLMVLRPVHPPDLEINDPGDPSEGSHWWCKGCAYGEYDPRPVEEIQKSIGLD